MAKNLCGKTRKVGDPYKVWESDDGWKWQVLKKCQVDDGKPFARWFCFVTSPMCSDGEYGDVYVADIKSGTGNHAPARRTDRLRAAGLPATPQEFQSRVLQILSGRG